MILVYCEDTYSGYNILFYSVFKTFQQAQLNYQVVDNLKFNEPLSMIEQSDSYITFNNPYTGDMNEL